jgi:pimeloyl-ACP methyl ester carboxylesterase
MGEDRAMRAAGPLWVRETGDGPPLLLLHGVLTTGAEFDLLTPLLADRFRVLAPDLRGHGRGRALAGSLDADGIASDLVPALDALGLERVHLLGHSHGGGTAQAFALAHPHRVESLILVGTYAMQRLT